MKINLTEFRFPYQYLNDIEWADSPTPLLCNSMTSNGKGGLSHQCGLSMNEGRDGHSFQTIGTCMRANYKPIVPRLPTDRGNNPQAGKAQSTDGRGYRGCRSGNMPTPRRMTDCRITPFTIDTQTLPTAKTLHAFCSGAAHIFAVVLQ